MLPGWIRHKAPRIAGRANINDWSRRVKRSAAGCCVGVVAIGACRASQFGYVTANIKSIQRFSTRSASITKPSRCNVVAATRTYGGRHACLKSNKAKSDVWGIIVCDVYGFGLSGVNNTSCGTRYLIVRHVYVHARLV